MASEIELAPWVSLGAEYDSNYDFSRPSNGGAYVPQTEAGVQAAWTPSMRSHLSTRHTYLFERSFGSALTALPENAHTYAGDIAYAYLTSLRTQVQVSLGGFVYKAPPSLGLDLTLGSFASAGLVWEPTGSLRLGWTLLVGDSTDGKAGAVGSEPRRDQTVGGRLSADMMLTDRLAVSAAGQIEQGQSSREALDFTGVTLRTEVAAAPWAGARVGGGVAYRIREYDATALYPEGIPERRLTLSGSLDQRFSGDVRARLSGAWADNDSDVLPFERTTLKWLWEYAPFWLF